MLFNGGFMEELERINGFVLDNKRSTIYSEDGSSSLTFDFKNMTFYIGKRLSQPKPIRYNSEIEQILYWVSSNWHPFSHNEAVLKLFNNYHERTLLGLNTGE